MYPSFKTKLFFWFILGTFSVFFAEVISGAYLYPFFTVWGLLTILPLYTLHILVLSSLISNFGKFNLSTLFSAGFLFGMYEAYITKVLWNPHFETAGINLFGIDLIAFILLVLFWHVIFAFIIPLFLSENLLTNSYNLKDSLPKKITSKKAIIFFAILFGINQSINSTNPFDSLLSGLTGGLVIIILIILFRKTTKNNYSLTQLLPNKKELTILLILLAILYAIFTPTLRIEELPGIGPQIAILVLYLLFISLFIFSLNKPIKSRTFKTEKTSLKLLTLFFILFSVSSALSVVFLKPININTIIVFLFWIFGASISLIIIGKTLFLKKA